MTKVVRPPLYRSKATGALSFTNGRGKELFHPDAIVEHMTQIHQFDNLEAAQAYVSTKRAGNLPWDSITGPRKMKNNPIYHVLLTWFDGPPELMHFVH